MRRVVVTGLGMVSPLASGVEATWRRLLAGESGAGRIEKFDTTDLTCKIGAEVPRTDGYAGGGVTGPDAFNPDDWVSPKEHNPVIWCSSISRGGRFPMSASTSVQASSCMRRVPENVSDSNH